MNLTTVEQSQIFKKICRKLEPKHARTDRALPWALLLAQTLRQDGHDAILQAGSASWLRASQSEYDGASYFTIEWDPDSAIDARLQMSGIPPSFHSWVVVQSESPTLIDLTTGAWPVRCIEESGYNWPGPKPPQFLWASLNSLPTTCRYQADSAALVAALKLSKRFAKLWPDLFDTAVDLQLTRLCRTRGN